MRLQIILLLITSLFFISFNNFIFAQDEPPVKWGEIPRSDLEMKSFPQDTNATALILSDYGESHFNDELNIVYSRHLRVKILTTKGYEWGTHSVVLYTSKHTERIDDITGATYWIDEKGSIAKQELSSKDIFEEDLDGERTRYRFTLPALKPGCVIELKYKIESENIVMIRGWAFQHSEPVRWSEYRLRVPKCIAYSAVARGYEQFAINDREDVTQYFSGQALSLLGKNIFDCNQWRWAVQDAPAIREEAFITTTDDYINQVDLQLAEYSLIGIGHKQIMNNWNSLAEELLDNKYFGKRIEDTRLVTRTAEEITRNLTSPEEKMKAIYNWVAKSIVCSGRNEVFTDQEVNEVIDSKKGSNSDITFLLLSLLKSVGISGDPVILSTRSNGKIQDLYPILSQFNYVLARVSIEGKYYYLDATDPQRTFDVLPSKVLNVKGVVIKKEPIDWVTLATDKRYIDNSITNIILSDDGSIKGTVEDQLSEYAALRVRRNLKDSKEVDVAKELLETEKSGLSLDSLSISGSDSIDIPVRINASISSSSYAQGNGDLIYFNPHMINRLRENPLKTKDRKYSLDFSYRSSYKTFIHIALPDSFEVKDSLRSVSFSAAVGSLVFSRQVQFEKNHINILTKFDTKDTEIKPLYYQQVREFYARVVATNSEQLVLSRIKKGTIQEQTNLTPIKTATPEPLNPKVDTKNIKGKRKK